MKIHHIGYLVEDIKRAKDQFAALCGSIEFEEEIFDEDRLVEICFGRTKNLVIELVSPQEGSIDVGKSLRKLKNTPYHICFECENMNESVASLCETGCVLVKEPQKAIAINGRRVAFLYSDSIGLFELVEAK